MPSTASRNLTSRLQQQIETATGLRVLAVKDAASLDRAFNAGLGRLYQDVFAEPPYNESFTAQEVRDEFTGFIAKGGITSSDVFTRGLGARRAMALGSLLPGMVSVWRAEDGIDPGLPYMVFAGNVGGEGDLLTAVRVMGGGPSR